MDDTRRELMTECVCGCQVVEYLWVENEHGDEWQEWVCVRCGREAEERT